MAGLLLSQYNVLVLDEPGNHLDVDTVESLAEALIAYKGTVIFTSHDRHFMKRVATSIIEVRDGHVTNYRGQYEAYLYAVNREIEEGERELAAKMSKAPAAVFTSAAPKVARRTEREVRKELSNVEKTVARLDQEKKQALAKMLESTNAAETLRLHNESEALATQLAAAEDRWCQLQEELGDL